MHFEKQIRTITTAKWVVGSSHVVCEQDKISPETTQWLFHALTSPHYAAIPSTSLSLVAARAQQINNKTFSSMQIKNTSVKQCRLCFVTLKTVTLRERSVAKLCFKRVWVSTLLSGLDSSPCMPDRLYIKLSKEPCGLKKIFKRLWPCWTVISYTCFFQYNRDK